MPFLSGLGQAKIGRGFFASGTIPDAPTISSSSPGNTQLTISFTPPAFNGGLAITKYQYSTDGTTWIDTDAGTTSPRIASGLTNGTNYSIRLRAVNALGGGKSSAIYNDTTNLTTQPYTSPTATTNNGSDTTTTPSAPTTNNPTNVESFGTLKSVLYTTGNGSTWTNPYPAGSATGTGTLNGSSGTTSFVYGTTSGSYPNEVTASSNAYAGTTWSRGTTYYYKAKATNTSCSLQFNGSVTANGNSTTVTFEYGTSTGSYPSSVSGGTVTGVSATAVSATLSSLSAGTYYYRVKAVNSAGTVYGSEKSVVVSAKSATASTEKSFTPPSVTTLYEIALVGGGGAGGYASGGGGGQLSSYASATITGTVTYTVGVGGSYNSTGGTNDGTRSYSGGTSSISGTNLTLSAPGGTGGQSSYPNTGSRANDGGASGTNSGGTGYADMTQKSIIIGGGGGAGAGGAGGNGAGGSGTYTGGSPGAASSAYQLTSVGGGGQGYGTNGRSGTAHPLSMYGRGGDGQDPNNGIFNPGDVGQDGAVSFKYYGPA